MTFAAETTSSGGSRIGNRTTCAHSTSLPLAPDLRLRRTGAQLAQRGSTERLVPRALSLPRRAPPPLCETTRGATQTVTESANSEGPRLSVSVADHAGTT